MISRRADLGIASSGESGVWPYWSRSRGPPAWRDAQDPCAHQLIVRATLPFGAPRLQVGHRLLGLGDWSDAIDGDPKLVGVEEGAEIGQVRTTRNGGADRGLPPGGAMRQQLSSGGCGEPAAMCPTTSESKAFSACRSVGARPARTSLSS